MDHVNFVAMKDGTKEDYQLLTEREVEYTKGTADRLLHALEHLDKALIGYKITRLRHSVQSATRAWRDGADIDWIVSALLHNIGDIFAPYNHDEYAATILKPFVREQCRWVVEAHGDFQMIYYGHLTKGGDQYKRNRHKGHRYFDDCVQFCERWDQSSFDPGYDSLPLDFFRDMVREVFTRTPYDKAVMAAKDKPLINEILAKKRT